MRCICCNTQLASFDDPDMCKVCIDKSKDETTRYKDPQHALITDKGFRERSLHQEELISLQNFTLK